MAEADLPPGRLEDDPWAPLVLSLDGGGVRGLSSLYILRDIMRRIKELDNNDVAQNIMEQGQILPLPCCYFDLIVGTSAGGLIAIMLGRLRMGVEDCIKEFWVMANRIFRPHRIRFLQLYSRRNVQEAAKTIVQKYCHCHGGGDDVCDGSEDLRQYDYAEEGQRENKTCRVAVMTVREGGATTFQKKPPDLTVLFRSYNHRKRIALTDTTIDSRHELNPRDLEHSGLKIHEACSCTSAGPTYFKSVKLNGRKYIDGGVAANNPAVYAWNEATMMANPLAEPWQPVKFPKILVSLGTGKAEEHSRFGTISIFKWMLKHITDTHTADTDAAWQVSQHPGSRYFRFDVPGRPVNHLHKGLSHVAMDKCKKKRRRRRDEEDGMETVNSSLAPQAPGQVNSDPAQLSPPPNGQPLPPDRTNTLTIVQRAEERDAALRRQATEDRKGGYRPNKYHYQTFDKIRDRTAAYCNSRVEHGRMISNSIDECALFLRERSLMRRNIPGGRERWEQFRRHPNPNYHPPAPLNP